MGGWDSEFRAPLGTTNGEVGKGTPSAPGNLNGGQMCRSGVSVCQTILAYLICRDTSRPYHMRFWFLEARDDEKECQFELRQCPLSTIYFVGCEGSKLVTDSQQVRIPLARQIVNTKKGDALNVLHKDASEALPSTDSQSFVLRRTIEWWSLIVCNMFAIVVRVRFQTFCLCVGGIGPCRLKL